MKELLTEIRLYIAEKLLDWAFDISPKGEEGDMIKKSVGRYFCEKVWQQPTNK